MSPYLPLYPRHQRVWSANPGFVGTNGILRGATFICNFNDGRVRNYGLDVDINYSINKTINLVLKYFWFGSDITDEDMKNDANDNGYVSLEETRLNAPKHKGIIGINLQDLFRKKMFINISTRFVQQYDFYSGLQIGTEAGEGNRGVVYEGVARGGLFNSLHPSQEYSFAQETSSVFIINAERKNKSKVQNSFLIVQTLRTVHRN